MKKTLQSLPILLTLLVLQCSIAFGQAPPKPRKSPLAVAQYKVQKTYMKVVYSQPFKNDREIFGGLVPYDKVWRTGANEATEVTFTQKVKIMGKTLQAGTYSLLSIPQKDKWTVIFNSMLGMWGDYDYNEKCDELRVEVPTTQVDPFWEAFTIKFEQDGSNVLMKLIWDKTSVSIPIEILK